jgi:hypothetical protein
MALNLVGLIVAQFCFAHAGLVEGGRLLSTKNIFQASCSLLVDNKHLYHTGMKNEKEKLEVKKCKRIGGHQKLSLAAWLSVAEHIL